MNKICVHNCYTTSPLPINKTHKNDGGNWGRKPSFINFVFLKGVGGPSTCHLFRKIV